MKDSYVVIREDGDVENAFDTEEAAVEGARRYITGDPDLRSRTVLKVIKRLRASVVVTIEEET